MATKEERKTAKALKKIMREENKALKKLAKEKRQAERKQNCLSKKVQKKNRKRGVKAPTTQNDPQIVKPDVVVNTKAHGNHAQVLDQLMLNGQTFTFYYYDMNRNNRSDTGISPHGAQEALKRSGRYEGKHHIHVEVNNGNELMPQGQYTEDSNFKNLSHDELYPVILSTYQSLYERSLYDMNMYIRHNRPIDEQHVSAAVNQANKIHNYCDKSDAAVVAQIDESAKRILNIYDTYLSRSHHKSKLASHKQALGDLNIFKIRTANSLI